MHFRRRSNSQEIGKAQESRAADFLRSKGLKLLCRNYHSRFGEIDLIMSDSGTLGIHRGALPGKRTLRWRCCLSHRSQTTRIRLTAAHYLQTHTGLQHCPCRFDVLGLSGGADANSQTGAQRFDWIKNAFS